MSKTKANDQLLALLQKRIRGLMNDTTDTTIQGNCEDHAAYRYQCGIIHGLALAERELLDVDIDDEDGDVE